MTTPLLSRLDPPRSALAAAAVAALATSIATATPAATPLRASSPT